MTIEKNNHTRKITAFVKPVYDWLYNHRDVYEFIDNRQWLINLLTLWAYPKLVKALLREIPYKSRVLQMGATFGSQIEDTAYKVGRYGYYLVIDNHPRQIKRCENKYQYLFTNLDFEKADAAKYTNDEKFDVVICYNLLHELPPVSKTEVVDNALALLKPKGKAVFIEYHDPGKWNPLRYFIRMFNRLYQPFAEKIWERDIASYATHKNGFIWRTNLYYRGMFQKVVATKKSGIYK